MSFCVDVKNELLKIRPTECCKQSLVYGLMLFGRSFSLKKIAIQTGNSEVANAYAAYIGTVFSAKAEVSVGGSTRPTYKAEVKSEADRLKILAEYDFGIAEKKIDISYLSRECCFHSFIRGAFLACGNINDPEKEYRLEFSVKSPDLAAELAELLSLHEIGLKTAVRGTVTVLYTKESSVIEDLLTLMGAQNKTLDLIDTKIMKSLKNNINRRGNCDDANISKTVNASLKQRKAIEYLEKTDRLESLPTELYSAAMLRKNNPSATLKELCIIANERLTVSGLNHRLNRIIQIYENLNKK